MKFKINEFIEKEDFLDALNIRYGETIYDRRIPKYKYKRKITNYIFHKKIHLKENMLIKFYIPRKFVCDPHDKAYSYMNDGYRVIEYSLPYIDSIIRNHGYKRCMKLFQVTKSISNEIENVIEYGEYEIADLENERVVLSLFDVSEYIVLDNGKIINIIWKKRNSEINQSFFFY